MTGEEFAKKYADCRIKFEPEIAISILGELNKDVCIGKVIGYSRHHNFIIYIEISPEYQAIRKATLRTQIDFHWISKEAIKPYIGFCISCEDVVPCDDVDGNVKHNTILGHKVVQNNTVVGYGYLVEKKTDHCHTECIDGYCHQKYMIDMILVKND